jgi:hypothetical protein
MLGPTGIVWGDLTSDLTAFSPQLLQQHPWAQLAVAAAATAGRLGLQSAFKPLRDGRVEMAATVCRRARPRGLYAS